MKCRNPECGFDIDPSLGIYCPKCGTIALRVCPKCGNPFPAEKNIRFCSRCGAIASELYEMTRSSPAPVPPAAPRPTADSVPPAAAPAGPGRSASPLRPGSGKKLWIILAATVVTLMVGVVLLLSSVRPQNKLTGLWISNGNPSGFAKHMELRSDGKGSVEGISVSWSCTDTTLQFHALGGTETLRYRFLGDVLVVENSDGEQATYCKNGSRRGYVRPETTGQEALAFVAGPEPDPDIYSVSGPEQVSDNSVVYTVGERNHYAYGDVTLEITVAASYDEETLLWNWSREETKPGRVELYVTGKWVHKTGLEGSYWIQIDNVDLENMTITCSYYHSVWNASNASGTFPLRAEPSDEEICYGFETESTGSDPALWFYLSPTKGVYIPYYYQTYWFDKES